MAATARLEGRLTLSDADFQAGLQRAERRAQSFQGRLQGLFRRSSEFRAERALGGFAADLVSGDVAGAVTGLTARMSGLGLGIGIAALGAVELYQGIHKARTEAEGLGEALEKASRQTGPAEFNTLEGLTGKLAAIREARAAEVKHERGFGPLDTLADMFSDLHESPIKNFQNASAERARRTAESFAAEKKVLEDVTAKYRTAADIEELRRGGSEEDIELAKSKVKFEEKYGQLIQAGPEQNPAAAAQLKRAHDLEAEGIKQRFDLKRREEEVENRILNLQGSGLSKEEAATAAIRERINLLKQQLTLPSTIEEKSRIGTQIHGLENQLIQGEYQESKRTPQQRAAEFLEQQNFQNFIRRQTPSPGAYLSSPEAYGRRDILGREVDEAGNVIGPGGSITPPSYQTPAFLHDLDELGQHMTPFGGSDDFNKWFHPESVQPTEQPTEEQQPQDLVGAIKDAFDGVMEKYWG